MFWRVTVDKNATVNYAYLFVDSKWRLFRKNGDLFVDAQKRVMPNHRCLDCAIRRAANENVGKTKQ